MSRILCVIDGMTDPHFQVEQYGHLASMGSMRYVDTCGGFPPETLHCVLRLLGGTDLDAKTEAALRAAERCPFVLLHINGADEAAIATIRRKRRLSCAGSMIGCSPGCWRLSMRLWWPPTTELIQKVEPIWVAHSLFLPAVKW